jgi:hypothetical protein
MFVRVGLPRFWILFLSEARDIQSKEQIRKFAACPQPFGLEN